MTDAVRAGRVLDVTLRDKENLRHVQRDNGGIKPIIPWVLAVRDVAVRADIPPVQRNGFCSTCVMHLFTYIFLSFVNRSRYCRASSLGCLGEFFLTESFHESWFYISALEFKCGHESSLSTVLDLERKELLGMVFYVSIWVCILHLSENLF